jgi:hypothetical protein
VDNETLVRIQRNDPEISYCDLELNDGIDPEVVGRAIANNPHIKHISMLGFDNSTGVFEPLFDGVSRSQSLKSISLDLCRLDGAITKLFWIHDLSEIHLLSSVITNETVSALQDANNVEAVELYTCVLGSANETSVGSEFIRSINHGHQLKKTVVIRTDLGDDGFKFLGQLLVDSNTSLEELELNDCCSNQNIIGCLQVYAHQTHCECCALWSVVTSQHKDGDC